MASFLNLAIILATTMLVVFVSGADPPPPEGFYTTRYDHLDIENILNQKRLVYYYTACLLDRGPCTPQGIEFKRILPEALRTNCQRCTEKQRFVTLKSIRRLKKEYPDVWAQLGGLWDPTGAYVQQLEDSVQKKYNRSPEPAVMPLVDRFNGGENVPQNALPTFEKTTVANVVANKPISFATTVKVIPSQQTTTKPVQVSVASSTTQKLSTTQPTTKRVDPIVEKVELQTRRTAQTVLNFEATTKRLIQANQQTTSGQRFVIEQPTTARRVYNYDFAFTTRPIVQQQPNNGFNAVLRGVNNLIAPITDIAGKVITAGTDIAGMFLNVLGVRRLN